jgi:putative phosphoesterase
MKIGVFSDSHDHMVNIESAVQKFIDAGVEKIVHCGDLVAPFIKRAMLDLEKHPEIERIGVFGNNDGERPGIRHILKGMMEFKGDFTAVEWNGCKIAIYHGTELGLLDGLIYSGKYDLILTGHTHQLRVEQINKTLVVNPGETCGYLTGKATCAIINLTTAHPTPENVQILQLAQDRKW